jgi:hypothetical protein
MSAHGCKADLITSPSEGLQVAKVVEIIEATKIFVAMIFDDSFRFEFLLQESWNRGLFHHPQP